MATWLQSLSKALSQDRPLPEGPLSSLRYVVIDTELTSLDARTNRMLSLGAIAMDGIRIQLADQRYLVVNPGVPVPAETVVIHGLRPADVASGQSPQHAAEELLKFAEDAVLVGHFVGIDIRVLKKELNGSGKLEHVAIDTARVQLWLDRRLRGYQEDRGHQVERIDLASLAKRYGLEVRETQHALYDAYLTAQLWQRQLAQLEATGVRTLRKLARIGRATT